MQPSPNAAGRRKTLSYANMPMAFVRRKTTKKMVPANNKNQQTKTVAKKSRKATVQKSLLNKLIWAGVADEGGAGRIMLQGSFASPYPFLIEWKISVVRGHGGEDHPEPALNWSTVGVQLKPRECPKLGDKQTWRGGGWDGEL